MEIIYFHQSDEKESVAMFWICDIKSPNHWMDVLVNPDYMFHSTFAYFFLFCGVPEAIEEIAQQMIYLPRSEKSECYDKSKLAELKKEELKKEE